MEVTVTQLLVDVNVNLDLKDTIVNRNVDQLILEFNVPRCVDVKMVLYVMLRQEIVVVSLDGLVHYVIKVVQQDSMEWIVLCHVLTVRMVDYVMVHLVCVYVYQDLLEAYVIRHVVKDIGD